MLVTHLALETHTLYRNDGGGAFEDVTVASGLGAPSFQGTGFGAAWIDYDNDGWLDLLTVNGAVVRIPELAAAGDPHPLGMPNQLFRSTGDAGGTVRFEEVTAAAGAPFAVAAVSRGLAVGDLDNDGDADAVVTHNAGAAQLLLNQVGQDRHWLGLRLLGGEPPRDMPGAEVEVARPRPGPRLWRRVRTSGSYLSARDPRHDLGLLSLSLGRAEQARQHLDAALELRPDRADTRLHLGRLLLQQGLAAEAMALYQPILETEPAHPQARFQRAACLVQLGRHAEAAADLGRLLDNHPPPDALNRLQIAAALAALGDLDRALEHLSAALDLGPDPATAARAHTTLAAIYQARGEADQAAEHGAAAQALAGAPSR